MAIAATSLAAMTMSPAAAGSIEYAVFVNTSTLNGTSGFLDFQFDPGNSLTQAATAQILSFTGGTLVGSPSNTGNVTGVLPGTLTFSNSTALSESYQGFTFGLSYSFFLLMSGLAIDFPNGTSTAGSTFGLGVYDTGNNPILTNQTAGSGYVGEVDINLNGTATGTAFPNASGGPSVAKLTPLVSPEPNSLLLLGLGLAVLAGMKIKRVAST